MHTSLPDRLKSETRELHARAERAGAMARLLQGELPLAGYVAMLHNLRQLYRALEAEDEGPASDARLAPLFAPAWRRSEALDADLRWLGAGAALPVAPAMQALADRVASLRARRSPALAAHAYVRYLGDLHGGQLLAALVRRAYGWPEGAGTRFYDFGSEAEVRALRGALRQALAALDLTAAEADAAVAEARHAFEAHVELFEQLVA